jgi:hypothetical protein
MPPTTSTSAPKRKTPSFKPPRPASRSTKTTAAPRRKSAPTGKRGRPSFVPDEASASDNDEDAEDDDDDDDIPSDTHIPVHSASEEDSDTSLPTHGAATSTQDAPPTIPPALLTRLLHHQFKESKTRIGKDAKGVVGKYMETFVREAIARAAFERSEAVAQGTVPAGLAGEFLEVSL